MPASVANLQHCLGIAAREGSLHCASDQSAGILPWPPMAATGLAGPETAPVSLAQRRKQMRKFLLASVATLGTGGLMGAAFAQAPAGTGPVGGPTQGQVAWPLANPLASANTNNNYQAPALPGPLANPTPGTIVIHVAGKVQTTFQSSWSSLDQRTFVAPAGAAGGPPITVTAAGPGGGIVGGHRDSHLPAFVLGNNGTGTAKLDPYFLSSFMRLYFGADAMATNGLRYGAGIELRENFPGFQGTNPTRVRVGSLRQHGLCAACLHLCRQRELGSPPHRQADGVIGIFDNGVTTGQFLINGLGGGDLNGYIGNACGSILLPVHAGRRVRQHETGLSVTPDRRLRLRPPVGAELVERLCRWQQRRRRWKLNHRLWHRYRSDLRHSDLRMPEPVVRPRHPGRLKNHQPDRAGPSLPGHSRRRGHIGLCRVGA